MYIHKYSPVDEILPIVADPIPDDGTSDAGAGNVAEYREVVLRTNVRLVLRQLDVPGTMCHDSRWYKHGH